MNVSEKIRYYRELRGLTQQQLADFSGIPLGTLKKYETGNRNPKQEPLQRIADALHISIIFLVFIFATSHRYLSMY